MPRHFKFQDDGEIGAGPKLLNLLELMKAKNVMVIVTRWYGGIHLGADRFKHICNLARIILVENGFSNKSQTIWMLSLVDYCKVRQNSICK